MPVNRLRVLALLGAALAAAACGSGAPAATPASTTTDSIHWEHWGRAAFERAKKENKLVFVDVGIEGCTACRWMSAETFRDANVVRHVNERFVAVAVDADQEPDVGERYSAWGWPAMIFLLPDGTQVEAIQGSEPTRTFVPILEKIVAQFDAGKLFANGHVVHGAGPSSDARWLQACKDSVKALDAQGYADGWGAGPDDTHYVMGEPNAWLDYRVRVYGETSRIARAAGFAAGMRRILDPVWGGVFVAAFGANWTPIVEKRLLHESYALDVFARELARTGDVRWREAAEEIHKYDARWMLSPTGSFYSTQTDRAPHLPANVDPDKYYTLPESERFAYGVPPIDHAVYTDQNAVAILAYLRVYAATGDRKWVDVARRAAESLVTARLRPDGSILQVTNGEQSVKDERIRDTLFDERVYLVAQAQMGRALLALHATTGDTRWLDVASALARTMRTRLEDPAAGGFFTTEARETDAFVPRRKATFDNVIAARFLLDLSEITKDATWEASAKRSLSLVADLAKKDGTTTAAHYALALERVVTGPLSVTITGDASDARTLGLFDAAVRLNQPRALVHADIAKSYPATSVPTAYVCTTTECSSPVTDPAALAPVVARIATIPTGEGCR